MRCMFYKYISNIQNMQLEICPTLKYLFNRLNIYLYPFKNQLPIELTVSCDVVLIFT